MSRYSELDEQKRLSDMTDKLEKLLADQKSKSLKKIPIDDLMPGMFIEELDIPWSSTPFSMDGFIVDKENMVILRSYCQEVVIDLIKSDVEEVAKNVKKTKPIRHKTVLVALPKFTEIDYKTKWSVKAECNRLRRTKFIAEAYRMLLLQEKLAKLKRPLDIKKFETTATNITESVINNPNGLLWQVNKNVPLLTKPIISNVLTGAIVSVIVGHYLGWPQELLEQICQGMLMRHMGILAGTPTMQMLYFEKRDKDIFLESEQMLIKLIAKQEVSEYVLTVVQNLNERYDGSGIPNKLEMNQIPVMAKIGGICDYYSRFVSPINDKSAKLPFIAMQRVMSEINKQFEQKVVDQLTSAVGIYPTRSFVKLSSGEIAVVIEQTQKKLFPKIIVLLKANGKPPFFKKNIDLSKQKRSEKVLIIGAVDASTVPYKDGVLSQYDLL